MTDYTNRTIHRGDVFYVTKTPSYGSETESGRPAIVVSNDINNCNSNVIEIVYLTTKYKTPLPTHVTITTTGVTSTVLCEQITSIDTSRLSDYIGRCSKEDMDAIDHALLCSLSLNQDVQKSADTMTIMARQDDDHSFAKAMIERDMYKHLYEQLLDKLTK